MEINATQFALIIGIIMALIEVIKIIINKRFGLEKIVSNHLQHKLEEIKVCENNNADKIVGAISEMRLELSNKLTEINTRLQK